MASPPGLTEGVALGRLSAWESQAVDAVGTVIEFWGFKRNHGRIWALLYLRGTPHTASEIQSELGLSKGAVSMITRELEQRGVLCRVRAGRGNAWRFLAEDDLMLMVGRVLEAREIPMLNQALSSLAQAEQEAQRDESVRAPELARVGHMHSLAALILQALELFLGSSRVDLTEAMAALRRT